MNHYPICLAIKRASGRWPIGPIEVILCRRGSPGSIINKFTTKNATDNTIAFPGLDELDVNGFKENFRIFMRRYASEFRDNYLCKNEYLLYIAVKLKNILNR
jgi:hypothetical protein